MFRFAPYKSHNKFFIYLFICIFLTIEFIPSGSIIYADTDTQVPTAPTSLISTLQTTTAVALSWTASTDNVGVAGYDVYKSGYQAQGSNLISNGGLESDLTGWAPLGQSRGNTGTLSIDTTEKYNGSKSAKVATTLLSSSPESWMIQLLQNGIPITSGKTYIVKFKAKSNIAGTADLSIERNISPYDFLGTWDNESISLNTQWNSYTRIFTATQTETANSKFTFYLGGVLRTVWVDDVEIYEVTAVSNVLAGTTTGTSITITGLTQGSVYDFTVKAKDAANNTSAASNTLKVSMDASTGNSGNPDTQAPTTPTNVTCTTKTSISVMLSWNASTDNVGVTGYDAYNGTSLAGSTASTSIIINGLTPNTVYNFTVKARDAAGNISASSNQVTVTTSAITDTQAPTAPGNLTCTTKTSISVMLSWNASTDNVGVTGYDAYNGTSLAGSTTSTSININGLTSNTTFNFTVKARDAAGNISASSNQVTVTTSAITDTQAPTVPSNLTCTTKTSISATLSWTASTDNIGVAGYDVYKSGYQAQGSNLISNGGFESDLTGWAPLGQSRGNTGTLSIDTTEKYNGSKSAKVATTLLSSSPESWMIQLLQNGIPITSGKTYIVKFKAKSNIVGTADLSIERNISPYDFLGTWDNESISLNTQWNSYTRIFTATQTETANSKFTFYLGGVLRTVWVDDVEIYEVTAVSNALAGTTTSTSITVTGLTQGSVYDFTVKAKDAANNTSSFSNSVKVILDSSSTGSVIDTQAPTVPVNVICTTKTAISVTLSWPASTDNIGVLGYSVFCGANFVGSTTSTSITINGLSPSTTYYFYIMAWDAVGNTSDASSVFIVTTSSDISPPTPPTNVTCTTKTAVSVTLSWTASTDDGAISHYDVYNGTYSAGSTTLTSITISRLIQNTTYSFYIRAVDSSGKVSALSTVVNVTTLPSTDTQAPTVPSNVTCTAVTINSATLSWTASTDNVGVAEYDVYTGPYIVGISTSTSITIKDLYPNTVNRFTVKARDASGNISAPNPEIVVITAYYNNLGGVLQIDCIKDNTYEAIITGSNIVSFYRQVLYVIYDSNILDIEDLSSFTVTKDLSIGADIPNTDLHVIENFPGWITFEINKSFPTNYTWSGIINSIKFKAKTNARAYIRYQLSSD